MAGLSWRYERKTRETRSQSAQWKRKTSAPDKPRSCFKVLMTVTLKSECPERLTWQTPSLKLSSCFRKASTVPSSITRKWPLRNAWSLFLPPCTSWSGSTTKDLLTTRQKASADVSPFLSRPRHPRRSARRHVWTSFHHIPKIQAANPAKYRRCFGPSFLRVAVRHPAGQRQNSGLRSQERAANHRLYVLSVDPEQAFSLLEEAGKDEEAELEKPSILVHDIQEQCESKGWPKSAIIHDLNDERAKL